MKDATTASIVLLTSDSPGDQVGMESLARASPACARTSLIVLSLSTNAESHARFRVEAEGTAGDPVALGAERSTPH